MSAPLRSGPRPLAARLALPALLALGALQTLAFAPTPRGGWLQLLVMACACALIGQARRPRDGALRGLLFGFGNLVSGVYWLYVSMHDFGAMAAPLAIATLVLFTLYLALYAALAGGVWTALRAARSTARFPALHGWVGALIDALLFGAAWTGGEWLRGTVFTGFPWLSIGYSHVDSPLAGFAPWLGVYGVSFAAATTAALLAAAGARLRARPAHGIGLLTAAAVVLATGAALAPIRFTAPDGPVLTLRLLQGNVPQDMKFGEAGVRRAMQQYRALLTARPADLVVTPETAYPILSSQIPEADILALRAFARRSGSALLIGAIGVDYGADGRAVAYTNSMFGIRPDQQAVYRYDKHHLVPFGEFVPWGFRWLVDLMHIPLGELARGAVAQDPFLVKGRPVAVDICYEDIFGEEIARTLRHQSVTAGILINSTNLAWFGNTIALDQHLQIARMRALETQRPMARATNTGVSAAIDAHGRVHARLPVFTEGALDTSLQPMRGLTPYIRFGNTTVLSLVLLLLAAGAALRIFGRKAPGQE